MLRLRAWARVVASITDKEKLAVSHEFIDTLGTVALGRPYAIKSRFAFAAGNLCHQSNRAQDMANWRDDFPAQRALYLNDIEPFCTSWRKYRAFKRRVEPIAGMAFKNATGDFRNAYNHRFSARFLVGMTGMTVRMVQDDGLTSYGFGGNKPLQLDQIADFLATERDLCYRAFEAFQTLVLEQCLAISEFEEQHRG